MLLLLRLDNCSHQTGFGYSCMWVLTVTCVTPLSSTSILWSFLKISNQACLHPLVEIPVFLPLCSSGAHSFEHLFLESQLIPFLLVTRLLCFEGMLSGPLHSSTLSSFVSSSTKFCHACLEWLFVWEKKNSRYVCRIQCSQSHSLLADCPHTERFSGLGPPAWNIVWAAGKG